MSDDFRIAHEVQEQLTAHLRVIDQQKRRTFLANLRHEPKASEIMQGLVADCIEGITARTGTATFVENKPAIAKTVLEKIKEVFAAEFASLPG